MTPRERLIVALDVSDADTARALVARLEGQVGIYKVGSQLFGAAGPELVRELVRARRSVFLDLKYHDIPNTVAAAARTAAALGVSFVSAHAGGGRAMLEAAARALAGTATRLLGITVLTSHTAATLAETGVEAAVPDQVSRLARLAREAGAHGVVASPQEAALVRAACGPGFLIVTPGVRPERSSEDDQARAATPAAAIRAGADYLVVGRPILSAPDPAAAAAAILAELEAAASG